MSDTSGWRSAVGGWQASTDRRDSVRQSPIASRQSPLLSVEHLTTGFDIRGRFVPAVIDVSFHVDGAETLCLVGESGSGKSLTALSILRLVQPPGRIEAGRVVFKGRELGALAERDMQKIRGAEISLIFQEPMTALNPVFTIGSQIEETLLVHGRATRRTARQKAIELLDAVSVPEPHVRVRDYPHQLSGGLRQRALIAMSLACDPSLLIADEPTTALDVTIQAEILDLLRSLRQKMGLALLLITHDLGVVAEMADRVAVMYAGRIVEEAPVTELFSTPAHPYTQGLLASIPGGAPGSKLQAIQGTVPPLGELPPGCSFTPRCPRRFEPCPKAHPGTTVLPHEGLPPDRLRRGSGESAEALAAAEGGSHTAVLPPKGGSHAVSEVASGNTVPPVASGNTVPPVASGNTVPPVASGNTVPPVASGFSRKSDHTVKCYLYSDAVEPAVPAARTS